MSRRHARGGKVWASAPDDSIPAILHPAVAFTPDDPVLTHRQAWDMRFGMEDDLWTEVRKGRTDREALEHLLPHHQERAKARKSAGLLRRILRRLGGAR